MDEDLEWVRVWPFPARMTARDRERLLTELFAAQKVKHITTRGRPNTCLVGYPDAFEARYAIQRLHRLEVMGGKLMAVELDKKREGKKPAVEETVGKRPDNISFDRDIPVSDVEAIVKRLAESRQFYSQVVDLMSRVNSKLKPNASDSDLAQIQFYTDRSNEDSTHSKFDTERSNKDSSNLKHDAYEVNVDSPHINFYSDRIGTKSRYNRSLSGLTDDLCFNTGFAATNSAISTVPLPIENDDPINIVSRESVFKIIDKNNTMSTNNHTKKLNTGCECLVNVSMKCDIATQTEVQDSSGEESEFQSSGDEISNKIVNNSGRRNVSVRKRLASVRNLDRKRARLQLQQNKSICKLENIQTKFLPADKARESVFELPKVRANELTLKMPSKLPYNQNNLKQRASATEIDIVPDEDKSTQQSNYVSKEMSESSGFGQIVAPSKVATCAQPKYIDEKELADNRIAEADFLNVPLLATYTPGTPNACLYVKNISKSVTKEQLRFVFDRFVALHALSTSSASDGESSTAIDPQDVMEIPGTYTIRHFTTGRMKGQAFVTLPNEKVANVARAETNGYIMGDKPLVVNFAGPKK